MIYELSLEADSDLEDIFDYTHKEFGFDQAVKYLTDLEDLFFKLAMQPEIGRKRPEIKIGLLSFPQESHIIFYRILSNKIRIVRVLHGSRDLPRFF